MGWVFPLRRFWFDTFISRVYALVRPVLVIGAAIMGIREIIGDQKEQILAVAAKYGASNVRVFGSVVQGTADENSDIDFLVDMQKGRSLFDMGGLLMELEKLLHRKADIVTEGGLHWYIKDNILKEAKPL